MDDYCRLGRPWFTLLGTMVVTGKYHHRSPPLFGNSIDMMLLYSSHLRRDGASPFLKRHCCFFFLLINRKLKEKHLEILKGASIKWSFTKFLFV
jgi:hypothetical protein